MQTGKDYIMWYNHAGLQVNKSCTLIKQNHVMHLNSKLFVILFCYIYKQLLVDRIHKCNIEQLKSKYEYK